MPITRISGGSPTPTTYLFIDGGYLSQRFLTFVDQWCPEEKLDSHDMQLNDIGKLMNAKKAYFFDCERAFKKTNESEKEYESFKEKQKNFLKRVKTTSRFHVILGHLRKGGKGERREQKETDIQIAVSMLSHAANGNMDRAVLIAGDRDFTPLIKSLVDLGLETFIYYSNNGRNSEELFFAADHHQQIGTQKFHSMLPKRLQQKHPLTKTNWKTGAEYTTTDTFTFRGEYAGKKVNIYKKDDFFTLEHQKENGAVLQMTSANPQHLITSFELDYGKINDI